MLQSMLSPVGDREDAADESGESEDGSDGEADLKGDVAEEAFEARVGRKEYFRDSKYLGEDGEGDELESEQGGKKRIELGVDVECDGADDAVAGKHPCGGGEADGHERDAGIEKEPSRTVHEEKTKMTPSVAPGAKVRGTGASVGREGGGDLGDTHAEEAGLDDHLRGELHAGGAEIHAEEAVAAEGPEGTAAAFLGDVDNACFSVEGERDGGVGGAVVSDDDLAGDLGSVECVEGFADADGDGLLLIEAGHDDGEFEGCWRLDWTGCGWKVGCGLAGGDGHGAVVSESIVAQVGASVEEFFEGKAGGKAET